MKEKILHWLVTGRVGASSKAMACAAVDLPSSGCYPLDPDDLNRCLLLLEQVPEIREHMDKVAAMNKTWAALVERWEQIEQTFLEEVGLNWSHGNRAPKTYELMKSLRC